MKLAERIAKTQVADGEVAIFYLAQAGFLLKTSTGKTLCIDPYFSDCCERLFGFKRMIPPVISAGELCADVLVSTHSHADHLDIDALPMLAACEQTFFIGAPDCRAAYEEAGISPERFAIIATGESVEVEGVEFRAVFADHGELAPDAIGLVIKVDGLTIYNVGDTGYAPGAIADSLGEAVDIMITPINGAFGNLNESQACELAAVVRPRVVIASHFGMFIEHGGLPGDFLANAKGIIPDIPAVVMAPAERLIYSAGQGVVSQQTQKVLETNSVAANEES